MPRVRSLWKLKSCVLRCPGCKRHIVVEYVGSWRLRGPSRAERAAAGIDAPAYEEGQR